MLSKTHTSGNAGIVRRFKIPYNAETDTDTDADTATDTDADADTDTDTDTDADADADTDTDTDRVTFTATDPDTDTYTDADQDGAAVASPFIWKALVRNPPRSSVDFAVICFLSAGAVLWNFNLPAWLTSSLASYVPSHKNREAEPMKCGSPNNWPLRWQLPLGLPRLPAEGARASRATWG